MISETGENLSVVIRTQTAEDWKTFATWYSIQKNLPDATVSILCHRTTRVEFQFYQWAKRLNVPIKFINPFYKEKLGDQLYDLKINLKDVVLMLDYYAVVTDVLPPDWLDLLNNPEPLLVIDDHCVLSRRVAADVLDGVIDHYAFKGSLREPAITTSLIPEAKDAEDPSAVVSYAKGCGKWIDTMRGCPFSNADGLILDRMTVNEMRIVQLWRKMVALFGAVN